MREAKQLFRLCRVNSRIDGKRARETAQQIIEGHRRNYQAVATHFLRLLRLDHAQHTARVECATPLPPDLQAATEASLKRLYGPDLTTSFVLRPVLIGGMRIQIGSDVYDGSVLGGIADLERS